MVQDTQPEKGAPEEDLPVAEESATLEDAPGEPQTDEECIARLEKRNAELEIQHLRSRADYTNLRRRTLQDSEAAALRRMQPLLEELLFVLDFLDMALASPAESDDAKNLALGVQMTRTKFAQALEGSDVVEISTEGQFDPQQHDARGTRAVEGVPEGDIVEVVRRGYLWRDTVLRPAQVIVCGEASEETGASSAEEEGRES